jgi:hypothetical protein
MSPDLFSNHEDRGAIINTLQAPEQQTLEQLYGNARTNGANLPPGDATAPVVRNFVEKLNSLRETVGGNANGFCFSALEIVKQEREIEFQVEEVREVQLPTHYKALKFPGLHPAITAFVDKGVLKGTEGYMNIFTAMSRTSLGERFGIEGSDSRVFASVEFIRTVKKGPTDSFLVSPKSSAVSSVLC